MTKSVRIYDKEYNSLLNYPFKSKYKYIDNYIQPFFKSDIKTEPFIPDFKLKSCKELSKPNFSNEPGCWEADLMFSKYYTRDLTKENKIYLVLINTNTRYLIVEPVKDKGNIWFSLERIIIRYPQFIFKTIKCDGEPGLKEMKDNSVVIWFSTGETTLIFDLKAVIKEARIKEFDKILSKILVNHKLETLKKLLKKSDYYKPRFQRLLNLQFEDIQFWENTIDSITDFYPIRFIINDSPYALAHKNVDSVIRTLRNAFGLDERRLSDYNLMRQMVDYYNNTPHSSLRFKNFDYDPSDFYDKNLVKPTKYIYYTPAQMQNNVDLEWRYIRKMQMKLREINDKQRFKGLLSYNRGNIILVHLDKSKTQKKHEKRRRVFNEIAEFLEYRNGNVICKLLKPYQTVKKDEPQEKHSKGRKRMTDAEKAIIEVPIIYTKFICNSFGDLNEDYIKYFNI